MPEPPQFRFEHWQMLWLLALAVGAGAVIWLGFRLKDRALRAFAHVEALRRIAASSSYRVTNLRVSVSSPTGGYPLTLSIFAPRPRSFSSSFS